LGPVRANPAGAMGRSLQVEVALRVCPPGEGLIEIQRKRLELKHHLLSLLSGKTVQELEDPLRVEKLQKEVVQMVNKQVLKKGRCEQALITGFELR
jgi:flagellar basal body-associated protein FliL